MKRIIYLISFFYISLCPYCIAQSVTYAVGNVHDMVVGRTPSDANTLIYIAEDSTIDRSLNGGGAWTKVSQLNGIPFVITCKPTMPTHLVVGIEHYVYYSDESGTNWIITNENNDIVLVPLRLVTSKVNENLMFLGIKKYRGFPSMKRSTNGGQNWSDVNSFFGDIQTDVTAITSHPTNMELAFAGGSTPTYRTFMLASKQSNPTVVEPLDSNGVFYSADTGITWSPSGHLHKNIRAIATYARNTTTYVFAGTDDHNVKLVKSTNAVQIDATWSTVTTYEGGLISDICADQNNIIYIAAENGVFKSTNDGDSWNNLTGEMLNFTNIKRISIDPQDANNVFALSTTTLYKSTDGGTNWSNATPTFVDEQKGSPAEFKLEENYPNPFNPTTKIKFGLTDYTFVLVEIYDVFGREVATLVNEKKQAGEYEVEWNAENIASGVYYCRLTAFSDKQSRQMRTLKMLLVR
jgi:hypothetical protein